MPGLVQHVNESLQCAHAAVAQGTAASPRVKVGGQPVLVQSDTFTVSGCPFTVGNKPQPCVTIKWTTAATRVKVAGSPVLLQDSSGICQSAEQAPQGAPNVVSTQTRVKGT